MLLLIIITIIIIICFCAKALIEDCFLLNCYMPQMDGLLYLH